MQTYVNIFQIKILYIFLYLVNATIRILNKCSLWVRHIEINLLLLTRYTYRKRSTSFWRRFRETILFKI